MLSEPITSVQTKCTAVKVRRSEPIAGCIIEKRYAGMERTSLRRFRKYSVRSHNLAGYSHDHHLHACIAHCNTEHVSWAQLEST